jgi:hypothetical protein
MAAPNARASEGIMAIVRETLSISPAAARPIRNAALDEGIIVRHLLIAMQRTHPSCTPSHVVASREFVQRLVDQHPPTQALLQRIFPAALLSTLRRPPPGAAGTAAEELADGVTAKAAPHGPNWPLFWEVASSETHALAGLVWDEGTRHTLRQCVALSYLCLSAFAMTRYHVMDCRLARFA